MFTLLLRYVMNSETVPLKQDRNLTQSRWPLFAYYMYIYRTGFLKTVSIICHKSPIFHFHFTSPNGRSLQAIQKRKKIGKGLHLPFSAGSLDLYHASLVFMLRYREEI